MYPNAQNYTITLLGLPSNSPRHNSVVIVFILNLLRLTFFFTFVTTVTSATVIIIFSIIGTDMPTCSRVPTFTFVVSSFTTSLFHYCKTSLNPGKHIERLNHLDSFVKFLFVVLREQILSALFSSQELKFLIG